MKHHHSHQRKFLYNCTSFRLPNIPSMFRCISPVPSPLSLLPRKSLKVLKMSAGFSTNHQKLHSKYFLIAFCLCFLSSFLNSLFNSKFSGVHFCFAMVLLLTFSLRLRRNARVIKWAPLYYFFGFSHKTQLRCGACVWFTLTVPGRKSNG